MAEIIAEGEGWVASADGFDRRIFVRSDDGQSCRSIVIRTESVVADMMASAQWVSSLSERERERALAAVQALEAADVVR